MHYVNLFYTNEYWNINTCVSLFILFFFWFVYRDVDDNEVGLKTPKYLQCPAVFTVAHLKKFILFKFGIDDHQFCVEIMYKVKTIVLPDHYTLMDVAYIYTWKRVSNFQIIAIFYLFPICIKNQIKVIIEKKNNIKLIQEKSKFSIRMHQ